MRNNILILVALVSAKVSFGTCQPEYSRFYSGEVTWAHIQAQIQSCQQQALTRIDNVRRALTGGTLADRFLADCRRQFGDIPECVVGARRLGYVSRDPVTGYTPATSYGTLTVPVIYENILPGVGFNGETYGWDD